MSYPKVVSSFSPSRLYQLLPLFQALESVREDPVGIICIAFSLCSGSLWRVVPQAALFVCSRQVIKIMQHCSVSPSLKHSKHPVVLLVRSFMLYCVLKNGVLFSFFMQELYIWQDVLKSYFQHDTMHTLRKSSHKKGQLFTQLPLFTQPHAVPNLTFSVHILLNSKIVVIAL